jgi:hypothetical protein
MVLVCDAQDIGPALSIALVRHLTCLATAVMPVRIGKIFLCNAPFFVDSLVVPMLTAAMTEKMKRRLLLIGSDYAQMHAFVHRELLPRSVGGHVAADEQDLLTSYLEFLCQEAPPQQVRVYQPKYTRHGGRTPTLTRTGTTRASPPKGNRPCATGTKGDPC